MRIGRGERIRTSGPYVPNVVLYQTELHPDFDLVGARNREIRQLLQRRALGRFGKHLSRFLG